MHTKRVTVSFIILLILPCGLALGGFASPAAAKTIVVTTLTDTADPPFNADGLCGTGTINDLPGTDHLISLREALIVANNTMGADTITFDPSLSGGIIAVNFDVDADGNPDPLSALCGGQTRIEGDLNGDDTPDITLEGSAFPDFSFAAGILVISSHNTGTDIVGEGGYSGSNILFPVPNQGTGNVLAGEISKNTATTVTVADGTPGNTASVTQFNNVPCP